MPTAIESPFHFEIVHMCRSRAVGKCVLGKQTKNAQNQFIPVMVTAMCRLIFPPPSSPLLLFCRWNFKRVVVISDLFDVCRIHNTLIYSGRYNEEWGVVNYWTALMSCHVILQVDAELFDVTTIILWPLAHRNVSVAVSSDLHGCENIRNHINSAAQSIFLVQRKHFQPNGEFLILESIKKNTQIRFCPLMMCQIKLWDAISLNESYPCQTYILNKQPYVCVIYWCYQCIHQWHAYKHEYLLEREREGEFRLIIKYNIMSCWTIFKF